MLQLKSLSAKTETWFSQISIKKKKKKEVYIFIYSPDNLFSTLKLE